MKELGRPNTSKSYMWVFKGGPPGQPVIIFQYEPSRSSAAAQDTLEGYCCAVQTDGYAGYNFLDGTDDVLHLGCWAHARRMFVKAGKICKEEKILRSRLNGGRLEPADFLRIRNEAVSQILKKIKAYLDKKALYLLPSGLLVQAVSYTLGQWDILENYLKVVEAKPDNNPVETAKANGLEPYFYLRFLFLRFPSCPQEDQMKLLPWYLTPEELAIPG
jgi:transposase